MIAWWRKRHSIGRAKQPADQVPDRGEPVEQMLRRLDWTVSRPIAMRLGGDATSVARGSGLDLAELREYQPGDDVRLLDWGATARTGQPHVRQTYTERALDVWLLVDVSPSVDWGTARRTKRSHAQELIGAIAQVIGRRNHRIGAILFAERPLDVLPPATGRHHLLRLLARLNEAPRQSERGRTDLTAALTLARSTIRRPSAIVVVSDLLVDDGWAAALGKLTARHEVVVLRIADPRETELPDVGIVTMEDPETGEQLLVDTADRRLRERFAEAARAQERSVERELTVRGVRQVVARTDADLLPPLLELLDRRRVAAAQRGNLRLLRPA
jgi:uncharacterized protein (DUF58 family)